MKIVIQRSKAASVTVDGAVTGAIDKGLVLLVGVTHEDTAEDVAYAARKIAAMRIFEDVAGKMNDDIRAYGGAILSISQFTLYASTKKGNRPSFTGAARPELAELLWQALNDALRAEGLTVETGIFGAMMDVALINDGPVTIILDTKER